MCKLMCLIVSRGPTSAGRSLLQMEGIGAVQLSWQSPSLMWRTSLHSGRQTNTRSSYLKTLSETLQLWYVLNVTLNTYNLLEFYRYVNYVDVCLFFTSINNRITVIWVKSCGFQWFHRYFFYKKISISLMLSIMWMQDQKQAAKQT